MRSIPLFLVLGACSGASSRPSSELENRGSSAGAPDPGAAAVEIVHFDLDCFDVYAECPPLRDLPAISSDGARIAFPDLGPEDMRDEFQLTLRVFDVASGRAMPQGKHDIPIFTLEDRARGMSDDAGAMSPELRAEVEARARRAESMLKDGGFTPLRSLGDFGRGHVYVADEIIVSLYPRELVITDHGLPRWRWAFEPSEPRLRENGVSCGGQYPSGVELWLAREHGVAMARVIYTASYDCTEPDPILISRQVPGWIEVPVTHDQ